MRSTHGALLTSLARYALPFVGMLAYEVLRRRLEVQYASVAACRITRVSRAARLEILHPVADVPSVRNLLIRECAHMVDRAPSARSSSAQEQIRRFVGELYGQRIWAPAMVEVRVSDCLDQRVGGRG